MTTTTRDTSKATLTLNVSRHPFNLAPSTHDQTHLDSMHACLNIDEIIRLIARELVASGGNATAVGLACCCKSYEDPVLDVLWATQDRLLPLFKSLPGGVWNGGGCTVSVSTTSIFLFLTIRLESLSKDFQRRRNGLVSGSTPEGCENSVNTAFGRSLLRKSSRPPNFAPSANLYSRI